MSLVHSDRLETLLGRYAVGTADCLTDPALITLAQDYRRAAQARMKPIDADSLRKLPVADYHVSLKIDGEFNLLIYSEGEAILVNPGGTVRAGLPDPASAAWHLQAAGIRSAVFAGELWYDRDGRRERVHDVSRVARNPASEEDLLNLRFTAFDLLDLDGKQKWGSHEEVLSVLESLHIATPPHCLLKHAADIGKQFQDWVAGGCEGAVIRSDAGGCYKLKPRRSIDAVVIGFTEATDERRGMIHDLLVALMRADGTFHVLGRVGGGFSEDQRREWFCDLQDLIVESDYIEANDGVAYQMVWPRHVIEISVLDLLTENTRGAAVQSMVVDWQAGGDDSAADSWRGIRKLPLAAMISPQFVRRRDDKSVNPADLRLEQVTSLVEVPLADRDALSFTLPKSEILRREVYTKQLKGQTMVRKLVMWQTNKAHDSQDSAAQDFPAYVIAFTDYSPNRKTPLERDIRVSNSREQIDELWGELAAEYIVKGWTRADREAVRRAG